MDIPNIQALGPILGGMTGAMVGSFLNVCIFRMPRGLSVVSPSRSFCPQCSHPISWKENIPVLSWIFLRGRCSACSRPISLRYPGVEALTAFLFACVCVRTGVFQPQDVARAAFWCTLISLLIVAAFVDWDHMIIPDEVSLGGVALGCLGALLHPPLLHAEHWWEAAGLSVLGALVGYGLLWAVAQGGRLLFGRARLVFETPVSVVWEKQAVDPVLRVGEEELFWSELFFRGSERIILQTVGGVLNGDRLPEGRWEWSKTELKAGSRAIALEGVDRVEASVVEMQLPREVMGMGDVKLLAAIGAFLGWQAVLFVLTAGASLGALAGGVGGLVGRRDWASRLPFGPYMALGAVWWIFAGGPTLKAYWRLIDAIRVSL